MTVDDSIDEVKNTDAIAWEDSPPWSVCLLMSIVCGE